MRSLTTLRYLSDSQEQTTSHCMMKQPQLFTSVAMPNYHVASVMEKHDEMLEQGSIFPITKPTDWVSSLTYSWQTNGKLCVYDSHDLNESIWCDHYHTPNVEEIIYEFVGSIKFTKLDDTSCYFCEVLYCDSSYQNSIPHFDASIFFASPLYLHVHKSYSSA